MPYSQQQDDDEVIGTVNNAGGSFFLLDPDRYGFELVRWNKEEDRSRTPEEAIDPKTVEEIGQKLEG
jgi:hypothetical protein